MKTKILFLFVFSLISTESYSQNKDWLIGNWELTYDLDGDTKDIISFDDRGKFRTTEVSSGRSLEGIYFIKDQKIKISLVHAGKTFMKIDLSFDKNRDKLFYYSSDSETASYYTKK